MADRSFLGWPFFGDSHRDFARRLKTWSRAHAAALVDHNDTDGSSRALVRALGGAGWLRAAVPAAQGGLTDNLDVRTLCIARETLAYDDGLADFAFAMQGLGGGPISLFGSADQKARFLPAIAAGTKIAAFALSEPDAGSDVAAMTTSAIPDGPHHFLLDGVKTWISNGGIADHYVVFARSGEGPGARGLSAFIVTPDMPGFSVEERIETIAPHPLATLRFSRLRVPVENRIGQGGEGFKIAMGTLDVFRSTVGAAALGLARRAFDEALDYSSARMISGVPLASLQMTQSALAEMAVELDAAALLVYRAAWTRDCAAPRVTREAAMAKFAATENAQRIIDRSVQLHGGLGVKKGVKVEELYRDIRALRIYEGASEIQKIVVARQAISARQSEREA